MGWPCGYLLCSLLKNITWLYKDTFAVRKMLLDVVVCESTIVSKIDLKDFFLSGEACDISCEVARLVEGPVSTLVERAIYLLLDNQFVISHTLSHPYSLICITTMLVGHP